LDIYKLKLISREIILKYWNLCDHSTWTLQTDRQTDRRWHNCVLCSIAR